MQQIQLTQKERYHILASLRRGVTQKEIANTIGVHPSTISREIKRNKDVTTQEYHYAFAQTKSQRRQQNKRKYTVFTSKIKIYIKKHLNKD
jgi:IS30 family transposase